MLYNKAWVLSDLGRLKESLPVLAELITRFQADESPAIQMTVSSAREARAAIIDTESA